MTTRLAAMLLVLVALVLQGDPVAAEPLPERHPVPTRVWLPGPDLEHPQNWAVAIDADGTVIVATGTGVLRFDGAYWHNLMPTGAPAWIYDVDVHQRRIVAGTADLFGWYEPDAKGNPSFRALSREAGLDHFGMIGRSKASRDGHFYATRTTVYWQPPEGPLVTFSDRQVGNLLRAADTIFLQEPDGLKRFDVSSRQFVVDPVWSVPSDIQIVQINSTDGRTGLLASFNQGLWRSDGQGVSRWPSAMDGLSADHRLTAMLTLPDGRIVLGTRAHGLLVLEPDGALERRIDRDDGLPGNRITGLALEADGGLWVSMEGGLARLDLMSPITRYGREQGVSTVMESVRRHRGELFAGGSEGLYRLQAREHRSARFERVPGPPNAVALWPHEPSGDLLVGADNGLWRLRAGATEAEKLFDSSRIHQLLADEVHPDAVVALSTGIQRYRHDQGAWRAEGDLPELAKLRPNMARAAFEAGGTLWAGTIVGDLYRIDPATDWTSSRVEIMPPEAGLPKGSWAHPFRVGDRVLFGISDGLWSLHGPPWQAHELASDVHLRRLVADPRPGQFWTASGLLTLDGDRVVARETTLLRLLNRPTPNEFLIEGETVWIAANEGILRVPRATPTPLKRRVRFAGAVLGPPVPAEHLMASPYPDRLELPMDLDSVRLRFALVDTRLGDPIQFRHRLLPGNGTWSAWSDEAFKDFTQLPFGESRFEVEAEDRGGAAAEPLRLILHRPVPWYLTAWARVLYVLVALAALFLAVAAGRRWRVKALEQRARELGQQVEERTETIRRQRDEIAEQSAARTRFFANVSHEFRTPLTLLVGPLQALRERAIERADNESAHWADTALRNGARLQQLVDEVLDLHRLEAGQIKLHRQVIDALAFATQIVAEFADLATQRGIGLGIESSGPGPWIVSVDVVQIRRCLSNLIGNALKFSSAGRLVRVLLANTEGGIQVLVEDQGPGIPAADQPLVFERYFQSAHHQSMARGGTGIGLALVRELVELHGGTVGVASTLGAGTRIWFTLPHAPEDAIVETLPGPEHSPLPGVASPTVEASVRHVLGSGKSLLIVDDNTELRAFLRSRLDQNFRVIEASDGLEGLALARSETPDLIVTDLMMPGMDGHELVAALRADAETAFIPVLMLSARGQKRDIVGGLAAGADDYLAKPFDTGELIARITSLLAAQHRLARRLREQASPIAAEEPVRRHTFADRFAAMLETHLGDTEFNVEQLAERLHMDRSTLFRKCQDTFSQSPADLLRQRRLERARELLTQQQGSVSEVAYAVGFDSLSHFSRSFKAAFGVPPSALARR
ncbi:MAG: response regulator [Ahniella sp.]|nr:response regulator [Ahniella sp.]